MGHLTAEERGTIEYVLKKGTPIITIDVSNRNLAVAPFNIGNGRFYV